MAHPDAPEAVDVPVSYDDDSAAAAIKDLITGEVPADQQEPQPEGDADPEADELDLSEGEEEAEQEAEPEDPAIGAPASLNAEEKAAFLAASPEAQQAWAASETRRNAQVQEATTKAANAQREANDRAASADAQAKAQYGAQLSEFVKVFAPQRPDSELARSDPATYIAMQAQFEEQSAQYAEIVQQVQSIGQEADAEAEAAFVAQRDRELMQIPEIANPETRQGFLDRTMAVVKDLGLDLSEVAKNASATDVKALSQIADWKEKAAKFDKAMTRQMQRVRAGKQRTIRPNAAQQDSSGRNRALADATTRLRQTGSVDDAAQALKSLLS